jgi:glycosyltransferase involved in cell wall biosynthesis
MHEASPAPRRHQSVTPRDDTELSPPAARPSSSSPATSPGAGRRKIVITLPSLWQAGTGRVCAHLANGFAKAGHDVQLVVFGGGGDAESSLRELMHREVRLRFLLRAEEPGLGGAVIVWRLVKLLRAERPDVVLSSGNATNLLTAAAAATTRNPSRRLALKTTNPILRSTHGRLRTLARRKAYNWAFASAEVVVTLSEEERMRLSADFPSSAEKFRTVANPYVTAAMLTAPVPARTVAPSVLSVGRLAPQKRMNLLIRAFAQVARPDAHLTILGEGEDRPALEALVRDLGLDGRVHLPGFVEDPGPYFRAADVFVLSSVYEGLPAVVLEAMAADCPVISTDCFAAARTLIGEAPGCEVLDRPDAQTLGAAISKRLGQPRPSGLRERSALYSVEHAVQEHLEAILGGAARSLAAEVEGVL